MYRTAARFITIAYFCLLALSSLTPSPALAAQQGSADPIFSFGPVYAEQNGGNAIGAVGSRATLQVSGLAATKLISGTTALIYILPLNAVIAPNACGSTTQFIAIGSETISGASFIYAFDWPATATKSNAGSNGLYAACIIEQDDTTVSFYSAKAGASAGPGTFTVTTDAAAGLSVTPNIVRPGDSITVKGVDWATCLL